MGQRDLITSAIVVAESAADLYERWSSRMKIESEPGKEWLVGLAGDTVIPDLVLFLHSSEGR